MKKCLILYASNTGNTEKVALEIRKGFERHGWQADLKKIPKDYDPDKLDFDFCDYDFLCVGSWVNFSLPVQWLVDVLRAPDVPSRKVIPGPKCGAAFCTFGGGHLGPREADACLALLEVLFEHLGFASVGSIAIPGKFGNDPTPEWFYPDLQERPNTADLKRVSEFVDHFFDHPLVAYYA
jgi:flavodoxin